MQHHLHQAAETIHQADALCIITGAGMSVDSGLPDFRSSEGLWRQYPVIKGSGISALDLASAKLWGDDPQRSWAFYGHRYQLYQKSKPHNGYRILKRWIDAKPLPSFILTTNVDGHFSKEGFSPDHLYEIHGSIHHQQCSQSCNESIPPLTSLPFTVDAPTLQTHGELPCCPHCHAVMRPNILMIGDSRWLPHRTDQQHSNFENWEDETIGASIAIIEIGAGTHIPTGRHFAEDIIGPIIRINLHEATPGNDTIPIAMGALHALNEIDKILHTLK